MLWWLLGENLADYMLLLFHCADCFLLLVFDVWHIFDCQSQVRQPFSQSQMWRCSCIRVHHFSLLRNNEKVPFRSITEGKGQKECADCTAGKV